MPKLSIITINLNNASGLKKTIDSIINQSFKDFEYIIIDGGSIDGSVGIIEDFSAKLCYWTSEPDTGIYNAMNKGIMKAAGDYCLFLNSGDFLLKTSVLDQIFSNHYSEDLICCKIHNHSSYYQGLIQLPKKKLTFFDFFTASLSHPSTFIKTKLFRTHGLYDDSLRIAADWKFFLEAVIIFRCSYVTLDIEISDFAEGGLSTINTVTNLMEREAVLNDKFYPFIEDYKSLYAYKSSRVIKVWEKIKSKKCLVNLYKFFIR